MGSFFILSLKLLISYRWKVVLKFIFFVQIFFNCILYWKYLTVLNFFLLAVSCLISLLCFPFFSFFQFFVYDFKALFIWQTCKEILNFRSFLFPCPMFSLHFAILSLFFCLSIKKYLWFISCTLVILLDNNNLKFYFVYIFFLFFFFFGFYFILIFFFFFNWNIFGYEKYSSWKKEKKYILTV